MRGPLFVLVFGLLVQQGPVPDDPGRVHGAHPPDGFTCEQHDPIREHDCTCKRMAGGVDDPLCENEPDPRECTVWCYAHAHQVPDGMGGMRWHGSHCRCPITCQVPHATSTLAPDLRR